MVPTEQSLKNRFIGLHGYWSADIDRAMCADPGFFAAYLDLSFPPTRARVLDAKTRELVLIAANAAVTHLDESEIAEHMRCALRVGASRAEILDVLQLTSVLGMHGFMLGAPMLMRESGGAAERGADEGARAKAEEIKKRFMEGRKYWSELLDDMVSNCQLHWNPELGDRCTAARAGGRRGGAMKDVAQPSVLAPTTALSPEPRSKQEGLRSCRSI